MSTPKYAFLEPGRYARGWHIALFSSELQVDEVKQLHYFGQDVEIWKDKVYREDPVLCDGDGPINKLRRWCEQFYLPCIKAGQ